MINAGRGYLQQAPWIVFGPGAALFVTVIGLNFVGDAVRDALDPRLAPEAQGAILPPTMPPREVAPPWR